jgi:hypothetical protein
MAEEDPLEIPYGQKLFVLDGERSIAILEIRSLVFDDSLPQPDSPADQTSSTDQTSSADETSPADET